MAQSDTQQNHRFAPTLLRGLLELGPIDLRQADLALELGLSLWLRRCGTSLSDAQCTMLALREALVEVAGMNPDTEPVPLVGRSPERDLVNLAGYLSQLLRRAAGAASCAPREVLERA